MIAVNARFLTQPITGVQRFAIETSLELKKMDPSIQFVAPTNILHQSLADKLAAVTTGKGSGHFWEQFSLPKYLDRHRSPLLINLCNTAPLKYKKNVVVIHDLAFHRHPDWFSKTFSTWYNFLIPKIAQKALTILTVSQFSKNELISVWPALQGKIHVVGNGLASSFKEGKGNSRSRDKKMILAFSGNNQRKNPAGIVEAYRLLTTKREIELFMMGRVSSNFTDVNNFAELQDGIHLVPEISDQDLMRYYQSSSLLVYPSNYEGFGLPPLEALNFGCPSLLTNIPVFQEVYDDCAYFIDDNSPESIASGIEYVLDHPIEMQELVDKGAGLLEKYTFKRVAENILSSIN